MIVLAVVLAGLAAGLLLWNVPAPAESRLGRLLPRDSGRIRPGRRGPASGISPRVVASAFAGVGIAVALGGLPGAVVGTVVALGLNQWIKRLEPAGQRRRRERLAADLQTTADLLASCLLAGSTLVDATEAVGRAVGGPMADALRGVLASLRLGADPVPAWLSLADEPALAPLARSVARAMESGAPLAETLIRLADEQRAQRRRKAAAAAQRVSVRAVAPLGLCFLPAFVLLGVVPMIGGIARGLLAA